MTYQAALQKIEQAKAEQWEELDLSGMGLTELPPEIGQLGQLKRLILGKWDEEKRQLIGNRLTTLPKELFQLQQIKELSVAGNEFSCIPDGIIQFGNLQSLDFRGNQLICIPTSIVQLVSLKVLSLDSNQINEIPDTIGQLVHLQKLSLDSNLISEVPKSLGQLLSLKFFSIDSNQISEISDVIAQLVNLEHLDLSDNEISAIPESIGQLVNLQYLTFNDNQISAIPESIGQLVNLQYLTLNDNQISAIPESIGQLVNLQYLTLMSNQISVIPDVIAELVDLRILNLDNNQISVIPDVIAELVDLQMLTLSDNQISVIPDPIVQLVNLQYLALGFNQISIIPDVIAQLVNLQKLDLNRNQISHLPESIAQLVNLQKLDLNRNQISAIPESIAQLVNLQSLDLANNKIQLLPDGIKTYRSLKKLDLRGNPIPIPKLILGTKQLWEEPGDLQTILKFYFQTQDPADREPLHEAKLLIVGEGEAGKTTLAEKLQNLDFEVQPGRDSTEGIDVIRWEFAQTDGIPFCANIWDFGGQAIYHQTHQFFLTERSLYLLVVDDRRENPNFYYWLNVIRVLTDNSPVLVIQNEKNNNKCNTNEGELRKEFDNLEKFFPLNFATDRSKLETLQQHIQHRIAQLPQVREYWLKSWVRIRHILENYAQNQNYISLEEYKILCRANGITDVAEMLQISKALHELGICLHFQEGSLKHQIILKPEWVTNAIYKVVKNDEIVANNGCFTTENLKALWRNPEYAEVQDELLALMQKFNLCYPLIGLPGTYIAPQILPIEPSDYRDIDFTDSLTLTYRYEFMPKGLIAPFIVGMYRLIARDQRLVWRTGVILTDGNAQAEIIESYYNREIQIRVTGFQKRSLLDRIRQKIWEIHASYDDRLKYQELIPCNCTQCLTQPPEDRETYDLETLMERLRRGKKMTVDCTKSDEDVNIRNLIDDFPKIDPSQRPDFDLNARDYLGESSGMRAPDRVVRKRRNRGSQSKPAPTVSVAVTVQNNNQQDQSMNNDINNTQNGDNVAGNKISIGTVHGDAVAGNKIVNTQNTTQIAQDIKVLVKQYAKDYDTTTPSGKRKLSDKVLDTIEADPTLKSRTLNALKEAGKTALEEAIDHPVAKVLVAGIEGFIDG
jgi:internalin A